MKKQTRVKRDMKQEQQDAQLTPETHKLIVQAVSIGNYMEVAAAMAGVNKAVFLRWMREGAVEESGKFRQLYDDVSQAIAASEVADLSVIKKASQTQWQAAAWRLERRYKDRWGRNTLEVTGKDGGPISHDHGAIVQMISKIYGGGGAVPVKNAKAKKDTTEEK